MPDKNEAGAKEDPASEGGSNKLVMALLGVNMLLTLGVGGFVVFQTVTAEEPAEVAPPVDDEPMDLDAPPEPAALYEFEPFVVNLMDSANLRYVKVTVEVELSSPEVTEELELRKSQMRDMVISVLSNRTYSELIGVRGKTQLREELLRRMNHTLNSGTITRLYFVEFVVQ